MMKTEITIGLICLIGIVTGCVQRIAEYNPDTGAWRYKSNSFATDSRADRIAVTTPSGFEVTIDGIRQDPDSLTVRFNKLTGHFEIVTEGK